MARSASAPSSHHVVSMPISAASSIKRDATSGSASTSISVPRIGGIAARYFFKPDVASPVPSRCSPLCATCIQRFSAEAARDVILRGLLRRIGEDLLGVVDLDEFAGLAGRLEVEERGLIAHAGSLLHVVRD